VTESSGTTSGALLLLLSFQRAKPETTETTRPGPMFFRSGITCFHIGPLHVHQEHLEAD
jgi:hypothetical protein